METEKHGLSNLKEGEFKGKFLLEWINADLFRYIPDPADPFRFIRYNGEIIQPGPMQTNGGSVPQFAQLFDKLSPWEYGPAYMIHDWDFESHYQKTSNRTFEEVNLTLAEAMLTLMTKGYNGAILPMSNSVITIVYEAIQNFGGEKIWDKNEIAEQEEHKQEEKDELAYDREIEEKKHDNHSITDFLFGSM